ncbi:Spermine/spermidine synthase [Malonomonas rubra DSM 5091]|uniref:Spermine/spermidine synthase n=1 Tax=Malonomonas rubra DSM 5091 TaxID=1122189 RepID=A0A1M6LMI2_MALRU|nr:spermidine synthase [Malonomonas rubra]SHJ72374.1 Spermine/spermidine synthase [Malonomonas rubra DSM 5091]
MAIPWQVLDRFETDDEGVLELRKRGKGDFLITVGSQILMNSKAQRSEMALGKLGCRKLKNYPNPRVLVGGLGMAITLRAVLDELPENAEVVVAELNAKIHQWCLGPLAELTDGAAADPRVNVAIGDVAELVKTSPAESFDAIIYDLYRGPGPQTDKRNDPLYGSRAIEQCRSALKKNGVFAIWGENPDTGFESRLTAAGFAVQCERPGKGGYRHAVWVAEKKVAKKASAGRATSKPREFGTRK